MQNKELRDRLLDYIKIEGVNQKHIAKLTNISEPLLSRYKNHKYDLGLLDKKSLDKYLVSKGY